MYKRQEEDAEASGDEAGADRAAGGRAKARKKVGARRPADANSPHAQKRARASSPTASVEVLSASEGDDDASEGGHNSGTHGLVGDPQPSASLPVWQPLRVRAVQDGEPTSEVRLARPEDLADVDLGTAEFDRPIPGSASKDSLAGIFVA